MAIKFSIFVLLVCIVSINCVSIRKARSYPVNYGYPDNSSNDAAGQSNGAANAISADYGSAVNNVGQIVENIKYVPASGSSPDSYYPCD